MSNHRAEIEIAASEFREAGAKAEPGLWSKITQRPLNAGDSKPEYFEIRFCAGCRSQGCCPLTPSNVVFDVGAGDGRLRLVEAAGHSFLISYLADEKIATGRLTPRVRSSTQSGWDKMRYGRSSDWLRSYRETSSQRSDRTPSMPTTITLSAMVYRLSL